MIKKQPAERMRYFLTICIIVLAVITTADDMSVKSERFELWNECKTMRLVIEGLPEDAKEIGLTRDSLTVAARSRLRSARLFNAESKPFLYINVNVVDRAFSYSISFEKPVLDSMSSQMGYATTWSRGGVGTHGGDASFILSVVSELMNKFLDEYLRINEEAC